MNKSFDEEWAFDDGENLTAYDKAKAIWARAEQQLAAKDAVLRQAKEALERAIEQMHFAEPWSVAEEDIAFAIEVSTAIDKEIST